jgi:hypothetical protein
MLSKFWENTGEGLSERWLQQLLGPAFLFWGGGLLILVGKIGFYQVWDWLTTRDIPTQSAVLIVSILVITFSGRLMEQLRFNFMRFLEGYWGWPFRYLSTLATKVQCRFIVRDRNHWNVLMDKQEVGTLTQAEKKDLSELETRNHYTPADLIDCMPTTLGNILQSAESAPHHKYGLDAVISWPRLWLLLPKEVKEDLSASRERLDTMIELWVWGLLFLGWTGLWIWAIAVSMLWMLMANFLISEAARAYADLLEASFDLYHWELYKATRWPMPKKTGKYELAAGSQLNQFFWRGYTENLVTLTKLKE